MTTKARRRGFTLLELMVVLVLLAITAAAAVPAFLGDRAMSSEQRAATAIAEALVQTRDVAREGGAPATFVLAPADGRYWLTTRDTTRTEMLPLIGGIRIIHVGERVQCRFEQTGPATPCSITVRGTRSLTVRVDGWSGEIGIDDDRAS